MSTRYIVLYVQCMKQLGLYKMKRFDACKPKLVMKSRLDTMICNVNGMPFLLNQIILPKITGDAF